jgi:hypothetical protein
MIRAYCGFVFAGAMMLAGCIDQDSRTLVDHTPRLKGNVKSVSAADIQIVVELSRQEMARRYRRLPTLDYILVVDRDNISLDYWDGPEHEIVIPAERIKGKWRVPTETVTVDG